MPSRTGQRQASRSSSLGRLPVARASALPDARHALASRTKGSRTRRGIQRRDEYEKEFLPIHNFFLLRFDSTPRSTRVLSWQDLRRMSTSNFPDEERVNISLPAGLQLVANPRSLTSRCNGFFVNILEVASFEEKRFKRLMRIRRQPPA